MMRSVYEQENVSTEWRDSLIGFTPGRGMADAIFAVRQRMEKQGRRTIECLVKKSGGAIGRRDCQIII